MNSTFRARWLASSEVISQALFTSEQPKKNKMAFVGIFSQIKLFFGPLVIQLVWYILKQLFTSVSVKVVDIYHYSPPLRWIIVNYSNVHIERHHAAKANEFRKGSESMRYLTQACQSYNSPCCPLQIFLVPRPRSHCAREIWKLLKAHHLFFTYTTSEEFKI